MTTSKNGSIRKSKKLVIVGDGMCGKTCLLFAFKDDRFIQNHDATVSNTYTTDIKVDGKTIDLVLLDTTGLEHYESFRALSYSDPNIVLICFSVDNPVSVTNVIETWVPEVRHFCGRCPVILVACKKDLRTDPRMIAKLKQEGEKPVTSKVGKLIASLIKADAYMECSARTREGVQDLFNKAARLSLKKRSRRLADGHCVLY